MLHIGNTINGRIATVTDKQEKLSLNMTAKLIAYRPTVQCEHTLSAS